MSLDFFHTLRFHYPLDFVPSSILLHTLEYYEGNDVGGGGGGGGGVGGETNTTDDEYQQQKQQQQ